MSVWPRKARLELLNSGAGSAEASTSVRARVWTGILSERDSRACRAASLADLRASRGSGEGTGPMGSWLDIEGHSGGSAVALVENWSVDIGSLGSRCPCLISASTSLAAAVDWHLGEEASWLGLENCTRDCDERHLDAAPGRAVSRCPDHFSNLNLFMERKCAGCAPRPLNWDTAPLLGRGTRRDRRHGRWSWWSWSCGWPSRGAERAAVAKKMVSSDALSEASAHGARVSSGDTPVNVS